MEGTPANREGQPDSVMYSKTDAQFMSVESMEDISSKTPKSENKSMKDEEEETKSMSQAFTEGREADFIYDSSDKLFDTTYFHSCYVQGKMFVVPK